MINIKFIDNSNEHMDSDNTTLEDISLHINQLIAKEGREKIVAKSGIDKNILYRLSTGGNTNLDKYLKIKNAFPTAFKKKQNNKLLVDLPILGQLVEDNMVRLLNVSQPTSTKVLSNTAKIFAPLFGYLTVSTTSYTSCVSLFSTSNINSTKIGKQCINRIIMAYPENENPIYGVVMASGYQTTKIYRLMHPITHKLLKEIPADNNIQWAKWIAIQPFSFAENLKADDDNEHDHELNEQYLKDVQNVGQNMREDITNVSKLAKFNKK